MELRLLIILKICNHQALGMILVVVGVRHTLEIEASAAYAFYYVSESHQADELSHS